MKSLHPSLEQLALFAGRDLSWWPMRRVGRHVADCGVCRNEVNGIRESMERARATARVMPDGVNWTALAEEMTANIHVGVEAGECIAGFERVFRPVRPKLAWHTAGIFACATVIVVLTLWLNVPAAQMEHLVSALGQVRLERMGKTFRNPAAFATADTVVMEAGSETIELRSNGSGLALMRKRARDGEPEGKVSMNSGSAGVQFVDQETGQVTINTVYYAQQ